MDAARFQTCLELFLLSSSCCSCNGYACIVSNSALIVQAASSMLASLQAHQ